MPSAEPVRAIRALTATAQGRGAVNEDRLLWDPARGLAAVLDGEMGEGAAADLLLEALRAGAAELAALRASSEEVAEGLRAQVLRGHRAILARGREEHPWGRAATTCTALLLCEDGVAAAHVGDGRLYLRHGGRWARATREHSLIEQLRAREPELDLGAVIATHGSVITQVLGWTEAVEVVAHRWPLEGPEGELDGALLLTDGAWRPFDPGHLGVPPPARSGQALIDAIFARHAEAGRYDDATAVLLEW